ncbi:MAG: tetratricopeptide repeat protein [Spirochaetia bacterium]
MRTAHYEQLFKNAINAGKNRDYQKAQKYLLQLISETDHFPSALLYLGRTYHALGQYEKAVAAFHYYLKTKPGSKPAHFFLGRTLLTLRRFTEAVSHLKQSLDDSDNRAETFSLIGLAYLKKKNPESAVRYFEKAVYIEPENKKIYTAYLNALFVNALQHFQGNDIELAREMFEFIIQNGNFGVLPFLYLAKIYRMNNNYSGALKNLDMAVEKKPNDKVIRCQRAEILMRMGQRDRALDDLKQTDINVEQLSGNTKDTYFLDQQMAFDLYKRGEYQKVIFYGKQMLRRNPSDIQARLMTGEALRNIKEYGKAKNHFMSAKALDKTMLQPRYGLAMVLWETGEYKEMYRELMGITQIVPDDTVANYYLALCAPKVGVETKLTIAKLQEVIQQEGPDPYLMEALGNEYLRGSRPDLAKGWFERAVSVKEDLQSAQKGLIHVERMQEDPDTEQLLELYQKYSERFPKDKKMRHEYIALLIEEEQYETAITQAENQLPFEPDNISLLGLLAFSYRKAKKYKEAAAQYRQLLRQDPGNKKYLQGLIFSLEKQGKQANAAKILDKALDFIGYDTELTLVLGVLLYKSNKVEQALTVFRRVASESPNEYRSYKNMAIIYERQGQKEFAERFKQRAEKLKTMKHRKKIKQ